MSNNEYEDLISRVITKKSKHPEVKGPKIEFGGAEFNGGTDFDISWFCVSIPFAIHEGVHTHDFDEFLCFASGNPNNMHEFQAKIELELGEKGEKHVITEPTIIYIPKGLRHGQVYVKKVDSPFSYMKICLTPKYSRNIPLAKIQYEKLLTKPPIKTRTVKEQYYVDNNLIREEKRHIQALAYVGRDASGANLTMYWHAIKEPLVLFKPPHVHDCKQYELFCGGNPMNVNKFDSEIDIYLGEEAEKYLIDSTSIVHIKEGLVHGQVDFRKVDKPVYFINFFLSPECP